MLFSLCTAEFTSNLIEFFEIIRFDGAIIRLYKAILTYDIYWQTDILNRGYKSRIANITLIIY